MAGNHMSELSPRQRMINMMYLVLTALLALNISKEVLDAFQKMDNSIGFSYSEKVEFNEKQYKSFDYKIHIDADLIENDEFDWVNIRYKKHNGEVLVTYKKIGSASDLILYTDEAYRLINKHKTKAISITETKVITKNNKSAILIDIKGEVPSPFQIITTDSTNNFLRAALYFDSPIKGDSLKPVVNYLKKDMLHMLKTLRWYD